MTQERQRTMYHITEAPHRLYCAGVDYYDNGVTKLGNVALFDYYACDGVTPEQLAVLRAYCPDLQVQIVSHKYAPELKRVHLLFPKRAWYRATSAKLRAAQ